MSAIRFAVEPVRGEPDTIEVVPVVDGTPLTDLIHAFEREARMETRAVSYGGLVPSSFRFGSARAHYTSSDTAFTNQAGKVALLGCECGEWGCWPLLATVATTPEDVRWTDFEQPFRADRDYSGFGPFGFDRQDYDSALAELADVWDHAVG